MMEDELGSAGINRPREGTWERPTSKELATHGGLESCVGAREDAGEALTEGNVGRVIEPRNPLSGVPTPSQWPEGNIAGRVSASRQRTPRGQRAWHALSL